MLLELMVAAFILLVCIAPAMKILTSMYISQQEIIRENQRDHLAHLVHAKITELLYKRQIHLNLEKDSTQPINISDPELEDLFKKNNYSCIAILTPKHFPSSKDGKQPDKFLLELLIKIKDISPKGKKEDEKKNQSASLPSEMVYNYLIYVDAGARTSDDENENIDNDDNDDDDDDDEEDDEDDEDENDFPSDLPNRTSPARGVGQKPKGG